MLAENSKSQGYKKIMATRANLSKRFLFRTQEGKFIVSNLFTQDYQPIFAESVSPITERQDQWRRIVAAGVDQRKCMVFDNKEEADEYYSSLFDRSTDSIDTETGIKYRFAKLSKDLFMTLPEGISVASGALQDGKPRFFQETSPKSERGEQWKKIVKAGFSRIKCFVFYNQTDMQEFLGHRGFKAV